MAEDMALTIMHQGPLEWHYLCTKFHEKLPSSSTVISAGAQTQTDRLVI
jgi:hypothetical protein